MTNIARGVIATQARQGGFSQRVFNPQVVLYEGLGLEGLGLFDNYIINVTWFDGTALDTMMAVRRNTGSYHPCGNTNTSDFVGPKAGAFGEIGPRKCDVTLELDERNFAFIEHAGDIIVGPAISFWGQTAFESYVFRRRNAPPSTPSFTNSFVNIKDYNAAPTPEFPPNVSLALVGGWNDSFSGFLVKGTTVKIDVQGFNGGTVQRIVEFGISGLGIATKKEFIVQDPDSQSPVFSFEWDGANQLNGGALKFINGGLTSGTLIAYITITELGTVCIGREESPLL